MTDVQLSVPDDLLAQLDTEAVRRSITREQLLLEAARHAVADPAAVTDPLVW